MRAEKWGIRGDLLRAIEHRTQGRLTQLSVEETGERIVIEARSATYYAAQLAVAAVREFASKCAEASPTTLRLTINGHALVLQASQDGKSNSMNLEMPTRRSPVGLLLEGHDDDPLPPVRTPQGVCRCHVSHRMLRT